jgi:hypothetical protein
VLVGTGRTNLCLYPIPRAVPLSIVHTYSGKRTLRMVRGILMALGVNASYANDGRPASRGPTQSFFRHPDPGSSTVTSHLRLHASWHGPASSRGVGGQHVALAACGTREAQQFALSFNISCALPANDGKPVMATALACVHGGNVHDGYVLLLHRPALLPAVLARTSRLPPSPTSARRSARMPAASRRGRQSWDAA